MTPARGLVLVRKAQTEDTVPGGRILLPESVRDGFSQYQVEVIAVGAPALCETKRCERSHEAVDPDTRLHPTPDGLVAGAWGIVKHRTFIPSDDPYGQTFFVHQDDVLGLFRVDP